MPFQNLFNTSRVRCTNCIKRMRIYIHLKFILRYMIIVFTVTLFLIIFLYKNLIGGPDKVRPTWLDFWKIDENSKYYYTSDHVIEIPRSNNKYGFPLKVYSVTTEDDYELKLFRIESSGKSVVLTPGIYLSALAWFTIGNNSLPLVLSRQGYDVWVVSLRGTNYESQHFQYSFDDDRFWDFGLHELGTKDLPAIFEQIYEENGNNKMIFLGYSMGSTAGLIYCSTLPPETQQKYLERVVSMATIMHLPNSQSKWNLLADIWSVAKLFLGNTIFESSNGTFQMQSSFIANLAMNTLNSIFNGGLINSEMLEQGGAADPVCVNVVDNYVQIMRSGNFKALDYHSNEKNIAHYGSPNVPVYNISKILVPYTLIYGQNDALSTPENTLKLFSELPGTSNCLFKIPYLKFNHQDYVIAKNSYDFLYKHLAEEWLEASC